mmetsp:Transcript_102833/g.320424  ORF Transcript_102833/g.320424 Transcript_102833/m.320424 type:complete len:280 (+) Transcript_102833:1106-1945(+)
MRTTSAKIGHTLQVAVLHIVQVVVVADATIHALGFLRVVEVRGPVERVGAEAEGAAADAGAAHRGTMVEDRVHVDAHTCGLATLDHAHKLLLGAGAACEIVAHRLVPREPRIAGVVLVRWGNEDGGETLGTEPLLTLLCYIIPGPLKQEDEGLARPVRSRRRGHHARPLGGTSGRGRESLSVHLAAAMALAVQLCLQEHHVSHAGVISVQLAVMRLQVRRRRVPHLLRRLLPQLPGLRGAARGEAEVHDGEEERPTSVPPGRHVQRSRAPAAGRHGATE